MSLAALQPKNHDSMSRALRPDRPSPSASRTAIHALPDNSVGVFLDNRFHVRMLGSTKCVSLTCLFVSLAIAFSIHLPKANFGTEKRIQSYRTVACSSSPSGSVSAVAIWPSSNSELVSRSSDHRTNYAVAHSNHVRLPARIETLRLLEGASAEAIWALEQNHQATNEYAFLDREKLSYRISLVTHMKPKFHNLNSPVILLGPAVASARTTHTGPAIPRTRLRKLKGTWIPRKKLPIRPQCRGPCVSDNVGLSSVRWPNRW